MQAEFIPNSFQVPNALIDKFIMAKMNGNTLKCYLLVIRKTVGWCKSSDKISISQFMKYCGISKRDTAIKRLEELDKLGLVSPIKTCGQVTEYFLNRIPDSVEKAPETSPYNGDYPKNGTSPDKGDWTSPDNRDYTSPDNGDYTSPDHRDPQTNTIQKTLLKKTNTNIHTKKTDAKTILEQHGITEQLADDFLIVRKAKRAPLTQTAMDGIIREAQKAGLTLLQAITICVERGWQSFNANWLHNDTQQHAPKPSIKNIPEHTLGGSFLAKDIF